MEKSKIKLSLNQIQNLIGTIRRYLHNGGKNIYVLHENLDEIEGELIRLEKVLNEWEN